MGRAKQILVVLLVAVLMCLSACGQAGDNSKKQTDSNDAQTGNYVTLKAITLGQLPENGMDEFYEELDAMCLLLHLQNLIQVLQRLRMV